MVRILFVISCVAFFAAPLTAEAQIFRRGERVQRRFQQPPVYRQPRQYQPQPQYNPALQQPRNANSQTPFQRGSVGQGNAGINPLVVPTRTPGSIPIQTGQINPLANQQTGKSIIVPPAGTVIEGQFDPIVQTSGEELNLSSQVEAMSGVQPIPSLLENRSSNSIPADIRQKPIEPVEKRIRSCRSFLSSYHFQRQNRLVQLQKGEAGRRCHYRGLN